MRLGSVLGGVSISILMSLGAFGQAPDLESMDVVLKSLADGPVAKVNDTSIAREEFVEWYLSEKSRLQDLNPDATIPDEALLLLAQRCLGVLVERQVLIQAAGRRQIAVTDEELDASFGEQLKLMKDVLSRTAGREYSEQEALAEASLTKDELLAQLRTEIILSKMRNLIVKEKNVSVTDEEIAEAYEANKDIMKRPDLCHIRQIFVPVRPGTALGATSNRDIAREEARNALKRVQAGQSFEAVAKSLAPAGAATRTPVELEQAPLDSLPESLAAAVRTMDPGDMSDVIESEYGYHIIQLVDMLPAGGPTLEEATPDLRPRILRLKQREAVRAYCAEIMDGGGVITVYSGLGSDLLSRPQDEELSLN